MKKRILLIGYNYSPELTGIGKYSGEMMEWLSKKGHECSVITSYPYYPQWKVQAPYHKNKYWYLKENVEIGQNQSPIKIYRCPMYVPKKPTGLKRILSDVSFFTSALLLLLYFLFKKKFDLVISVAPTFLSGVLGAFYKILKKTRHVHHIQDLQIEAALKLGMIKSKFLINLLLNVECFIFRNSDRISSISLSMIDKIEKKCKKKVFYLPNWTDNSLFFPLDNKAELKRKFGYHKEDKIIVYSGAIGEKQGLEIILNSAKEFIKDKNIKFLICGSGPYQLVLKEKANQLNLNNITFLPLQPKEVFNDFLNMIDIHLVIQKTNASDLMMPSKLTTILAVGGIALITANENTDLYRLVHSHNMGHIIQPENDTALTSGINYLISNKNLSTLKKNAHIYASQFLSLDYIMQDFENRILLERSST
ncbi:WcaI family glycosyltransferase [Maribacter dokdonensis]|uniref:WcaI family glycosyltransferase n=1 Tax=Maribacter dokdonensis TaxID=320912 RepID=UPI002734CD18|nr:WcaI family glycosyltransferase [Maribacter dokdonensis]MDP2525783.1 WcaI family glycosyltransferase [Maribacter dokdonensis]